MREIEERVEIVTMMQLAETGFQEWNDPQEEIYDADEVAARSHFSAIASPIKGEASR